MMIETERLFLREMTEDDFDALYQVLTDSDIMQHYPYAFDEVRVRNWIRRNRERYRIFGFGLWAVCLKETGEMIGDCGLSMQLIHGQIKPEIGYHIRADQQRKGYAKEAAIAIRDWTFRNTPFNMIYSYMKYTNEPSAKTAMSYGCKQVDEFADEVNTITKVYAISKEEWLKQKSRIGEESDMERERIVETMIRWAMDHMGCKDYAGWCLSFIEDALEIGNDIEIFGGDCARESFELYQDAARTGIPKRGAFVFYDCLCPSEEGLVNWGHCGIALGDGNIIHAWDVVRIDNYLDIEAMTAISGDHPKYLGWVPIERVMAQKES